jgi:hypothetical protein
MSDEGYLLIIFSVMFGIAVGIFRAAFRINKIVSELVQIRKILQKEVICEEKK